MTPDSLVENHRVVSRDEWLAARAAFLVREKEFTRARDALSQARRELPWEAVTTPYRFEDGNGSHTLADLFEGRSQLVVYHFMFAPEWDAGCPHCSFWADNFNPIGVHLHQRDVTFVAISRAPFPKLDAYRRRMGWSFRWLSSGGSDFNFDFQASFRPDALAQGQVYYNFATLAQRSPDREGISVFCRDPAGRVFHTYSTYARGIDLVNTAYNFLDLVPRGRDEQGRGQFWVRRHDEYQAGTSGDRTYAALQAGRDRPKT
jgi:predicted dithiol-disulfide oxidoreductase (DUF899 family)